MHGRLDISKISYPMLTVMAPAASEEVCVEEVKRDGGVPELHMSCIQAGRNMSISRKQLARNGVHVCPLSCHDGLHILDINVSTWAYLQACFTCTSEPIQCTHQRQVAAVRHQAGMEASKVEEVAVL